MVKPPKPRSLPLKPGRVAHAVEFNDVAGDVLLDHRASDPALGKTVKGLTYRSRGGSKHHIAILGIMDIGALHPNRARASISSGRGGYDEARGKRYRVPFEQWDHMVPVGIQHRRRGVD